MRILFRIHAAITLAAGVVLIVRPELIPQLAGIELPRGAALIAYLLGAAELAFAYLSFAASRMDDVRVIANACVVFHAVSGVVEGFVAMRGGSAVLWANVVARVVIVALFVTLWRGSSGKASSSPS